MNVKTVTASEFRAQMKDLMEQVYNDGLHVIVQRHKKVLFMCVPPDTQFCQCGEDTPCTDELVESLSGPGAHLEEEVKESSVHTPPARPVIPRK